MAACALVRGAIAGDLQLARVHWWPALVLVGIGLLQLIPLPSALHSLLAPGSYALWHPQDAAAAAVLGTGARPISVDPPATLRWLAWAAALVSLTMLAGASWRAERSLAITIGAVVGITAVAIYGVLAQGRFGALLYGRYAVPTIAPYGPFVSKNHFAGYVALGVPLGLGLAAALAGRARRTDWRGDWTRGPAVVGVVAAMLAALAMLFSCFVSLSRGGALGATLGALSFGALWWWRHRRAEGQRSGLIAAGVLALAIGAVLAAVLPEEARERVGSAVTSAPESSRDFRLRTWGTALRTAGASPVLGFGFSAFADPATRFKAGDGSVRLEHAENDYLELGVEAGAAGLLLVLMGMALFVRAAVGSALETRDPLRAAVGLGALSGLLGLVVHSGLDFNMRIPSNAALATLLAALVASSIHGRYPPVARPAAAVGALALSGLLVAVAVQPAPTWERAREAAESAARFGSGVGRLRLQQVEMLLEAEVQRRPAFAEAWLLLAWARGAEGRPDAEALARYAVSLDPLREPLREEADRLVNELSASGRGGAAEGGAESAAPEAPDTGAAGTDDGSAPPAGPDEASPP